MSKAHEQVASNNKFSCVDELFGIIISLFMLHTKKICSLFSPIFHSYEAVTSTDFSLNGVLQQHQKLFTVQGKIIEKALGIK